MADDIPLYTENGLPVIHVNGEHRILAALPGRLAYPNLPPWSATRPILPQSQWQEVSLKSYRIPVLDQGQSSSCVGHASVSAFRRAWLVSGQPDENFSPWFVYGLINQNRDAGAIVGDALSEMTTYGVAPTGTLADGNLPPQLWYTNQLQQLPTILAKAKRFRIGQAWHLTGPDIFLQIGTALSLGFCVVSGMLVGQDFARLDAEGVAPAVTRPIGGHALHHLGLKKSTRDGSWLVETQNSWGVGFGLGGYCYLREASWQPASSEAFAILAATEDPQDTIDPTVS